MKHAARSFYISCWVRFTSCCRSESKKKIKKKQINQKTLDSVFNTVFINPDIYFKGTRLDDPERSKNKRV